MARRPKRAPDRRSTALLDAAYRTAETNGENLERTPAAIRNARTTEEGPAVSVAELALHLDMTVSRVSALANEGILPRNMDASFPQDACRVAYIRYVRAAAASRARTGDKTTPLIETKTLKAKLDLAIAQGEYVRIDDVEAMLVEADLNLRNEIAGIGAKVTRDLELRAKIEEAINDAIARHRNSLEAAAASAFGESEGMDTSEEAAA